MKKVILAYSGGLDTSCCIPWLRSKGFEVVCFSADLGSEFSPQDLRKRSKQSKASRIYIRNLKKEFAKEYILPALKAGAVYENKYFLSTALGRPLIAKHLVDIAKKEKASFIAHGCTGKGNDQVRIETAVKLMAPHLKIIAPLREWELTSRNSEIAYAKKNRIPIKATKEKPYSIDKNIWGISIESGKLEDLGNELEEEAFVFTQSPEKSPSKPAYIDLEFYRGEPVKLNGGKYSLVEMVNRLNYIGGRHSIGRTDLVEDRIVGIKSREIYEAPAAWILHTALRELESLALDRESLYFKKAVSLKYAQLVYQGLWFSKLKGAFDKFINELMAPVSGRVVLKLYKGSISVSKRSSKNSLYKKELATYGEKDAFNRTWAEGFINIWSMPFRQ